MFGGGVWIFYTGLPCWNALSIQFIRPLILHGHISNKFLRFCLNPVNLWEITQCMPIRGKGGYRTRGWLKMLHREELKAIKRILKTSAYWILWPKIHVTTQKCAVWNIHNGIKAHFCKTKANAKAILFFDIYCPRSIWTLNWILCEPIWKWCRFRFRGNINEPLTWQWIF